VSNELQTSEFESKIVFGDRVLRVTGALERSDFSEFKQACQSLCELEEHDVIVDLTHCSYMSSSFIGELSDAVMRMKAGDKDVRVSVSAEIGKVLHMARLYHLFEYEISPSEIS